MTSKTEPSFAAYLIFAIILIFVFFGSQIFHVFATFQEVAAYNRATGENVSVWDGFWVELRVVNCSNDSPARSRVIE